MIASDKAFHVKRKNKNEKILRAVQPNCGIEAEYRRKLCALIDEMQASMEYWLRAAWRANEPEVAELAQDELPSTAMVKRLRAVARRWLRRFNTRAEDLAKEFVERIAGRSDKAFEASLRKHGMSIKFTLSKAMRDVINATVHENVSLIKSIPQRYLQEVEGLVMRAVQVGGDLAPLMRDLRDRYQITKKRASLISRDQNSKANSSFMRVRQLELGVTQAVWMHSHAGRKPRPTHVAMNRKRYDVAKGMWDSHEKKWIWPGQLIRCRCTSKSVVPGFS